MTACARSRRLSFRKIRPTWVLVVWGATTSASLISSFERPRAMSVSTSRSRGVSSSSAIGSGRAVGSSRVKSAIRRRSMDGADERVSLRDDVHGVDQFVCGCVFEHEAACSGAERFVDVLVEVKRGEHEHPRWLIGRGAVKDLPSGFQSVHHRHPDVHQHDVGSECHVSAARLRRHRRPVRRRPCRVVRRVMLRSLLGPWPGRLR